MNKELNDRLEEIEHKISNLPSYIDHNTMSKETEKEIKKLSKEVFELKKEMVEKNTADVEHRTELRFLASSINNNSEAIKELTKTIKNEYLRKSEFEPIKKLMYGLIGTVLVTVIGAWMALIINT